MKKSQDINKITIIRTGFSLIEMLVVISVIGIILGVLLTSYQGTRNTARDGKRKADLESIKSTLEIYRSDCGSYPATATFQAILDSGSSLVGPALSTCTGNTYTPAVPKDPLSTYKYIYLLDASGNTFTLCARLEDGSPAVTGCGNSNRCDQANSLNCNYKVNQI